MISCPFNRQRLTASALIGTGVARLARNLRSREACVLTFHGLRHGPADDLIDTGLHTELNLFRQLCAHLAAHYTVRPLTEIAGKLQRGENMPGRTIALTFDDGYESNHLLAWPVLREFQLPATIFACSGFVDGTVTPWFQRLELGLARATVERASVRVGDRHFDLSLPSRSARQSAHAALSPAFKALPHAAMEQALEELEAALQPAGGHTPAPFRPMTWNQAREMQASGLIEFGGHTHTHPILARCTPAAARDEIFQSRDRLAAELGTRPALFAYTNGQENDFNATTRALLREAGFSAAFTMIPGPARPAAHAYAIPRYGSPESMPEAEATLSGAFETFKEWRGNLRRAFAPAA